MMKFLVPWLVSGVNDLYRGVQLVQIYDVLVIQFYEDGCLWATLGSTFLGVEKWDLVKMKTWVILQLTY